MLQSLIRRLYVYRFFDDFILIYPFYQLMFAAHGLSVGQISALFILWVVVSMVADVPTGVLADRYSRKNLLAVGQVIRAGGFAAWLLIPNFWGYAFGFALWGIGSAFDFGTFQALVFDELKAMGRQADYVRVRGRAQSWGLVAVLLATVAAAPGIVLGYNGLLDLSIAAVLLAAAIACSIPETPRQEEAGDAGYFAELWAGARETVHSSTLLPIIVLGGLVTALFGSLEEYDPLYFQAIGLPLFWVPIGVAALALAAVGAGVVAHRFERLSTTWFLGGLALAGACLMSAFGLRNLGGALFIAGFFFLTKLLETIYDGKLQHGISSHRRATITSVGGFLAEIISVGLYAGFGWMADNYGMLAAWGWCGVATVIIALMYLAFDGRVLALRA